METGTLANLGSHVKLVIGCYSAAMSIFAKILAGEIPCHRVYEDELVLAFLDVSPLAPGHVLLIPKEEKATLGELSEQSAAALGGALPRICRAVCQATGASDYNVLQNNGKNAHQSVMHVHFHIIPRIGKQGLAINWQAGELDDGAENLATRIATAISSEA